jgi:hypothetical protein
MPIEIMELVVKAKVGNSDNNSRSTAIRPGTENESQDKRKLAALEQAVKETLTIIKRKNER